MPISGIILEVADGDEARMATKLRDVAHLDVSGAENGCLIVVTDTARLEEDSALVESLGRLPGVRSTNVVFTNMEDT